MKIAFTLWKLRIAQNCNSSLLLCILETPPPPPPPPPPTSVSRPKSLIAAPPIDVGTRIFSRHLGPVVQQVVLNFEPDASDGAPVARANVRHSFNVRNGKDENCEKRACSARIPGRLLGNGRSQRHAVKTIR